MNRIIHIPKTGGTSIRKSNTFKFKRSISWGNYLKTTHIPISEFNSQIYFKFHAFVRDPLERAVSQYYYFRKRMRRANLVNDWWSEVCFSFDDVNDFYEWVDLERMSKVIVHLLPQCEFLRVSDSSRTTSSISLYDFGDFYHEWLRLCKSTKVNPKGISKLNSSKKAHTNLTQSNIDKLTEFYELDFALYDMAKDKYKSKVRDLTAQLYDV